MNRKGTRNEYIHIDQHHDRLHHKQPPSAVQPLKLNLTTVIIITSHHITILNTMFPRLMIAIY